MGQLQKAKDSIYVASALIALINERDQLCCNIICKQRILCWSQTVDPKKLFAEIDDGDGVMSADEVRKMAERNRDEKSAQN